MSSAEAFALIAMAGCGFMLGALLGHIITDLRRDR